MSLKLKPSPITELRHRRKLQYLIKWRGYPSLDNHMGGLQQSARVRSECKGVPSTSPHGVMKTQGGHGTRRNSPQSENFDHTPLSTQKVLLVRHSITPPIASCSQPPTTTTFINGKPVRLIDNCIVRHPLNAKTHAYSTLASVTPAYCNYHN